MKFFFIIILFFLSNLISANELENNQVEVITLHENKSLDQMVLDNLNNDNENEVNIKEVVENPTSDDVIKNEVEVEQIQIVNDGYIYKNQIKDLNKYFDNLQNITSKTLQQQIIKVVENIQFDLEIEKDRDILFFNR
jgi:hypothetical protein